MAKLLLQRVVNALVEGRNGVGGAPSGTTAFMGTHQLRTIRDRGATNALPGDAAEHAACELQHVRKRAMP